MLSLVNYWKFLGDCSVNPDSSFVYVLSKQISVFSSAIVQFRIGVISSYPNVN